MTPLHSLSSAVRDHRRPICDLSVTDEALELSDRLAKDGMGTWSQRTIGPSGCMDGGNDGMADDSIHRYRAERSSQSFVRIRKVGRMVGRSDAPKYAVVCYFSLV